MGDSVFINGRSAVHKGSAGKSMAAFPDTCLCPPTPPAGPVPTPLPNNALASDLAEGEASVLIEGNPAGNRKSYISKSTGNEVSRPTGGGVVSHAVQGSAHFASFSFDVKIGGEPAVRHLDLLTHNHQDLPNTGPWTYLATAEFKASFGPTPCGPKCKISTWDPNTCEDGPDGTQKTPHHMLPKHLFLEHGSETEPLSAWRHYNAKKAPCVCVTGRNQHKLEHGMVHARMDGEEYAAEFDKGTWTYDEALQAALASVTETLGPGGCSQKCLKQAMDDFHLKGKEDRRSQKLRCDPAPKGKNSKGRKLMEEALARRQSADEQAVGSD